jgi:pimeloyl-ACP methyl ester carboxylesterase
VKARYPDRADVIDRDGVKVADEIYGDNEPAVLLLLARFCTVVTFDPRGNGRSDRPSDVSAYDRREIVEDAIAVLDAAGVERAVVVPWCAGCGGMLAAEHPDRATALVEIATDLPLTADPGEEQGYPFDEPLATDLGWANTTESSERRVVPPSPPPCRTPDWPCSKAPGTRRTCAIRSRSTP